MSVPDDFLHQKCSYHAMKIPLLVNSEFPSVHENNEKGKRFTKLNIKTGINIFIYSKDTCSPAEVKHMSQSLFTKI